MTRKNIKVSEEWYEQHNDRRKDAGLTWEEYLSGNAPPVERVEVVDGGEVTLDATEYEAIARSVVERLR